MLGERNPPVGPAFHLIQHALEVASALREGVLDADWRFRIDPSGHESRALKLFQSLREQPVVQVGNRLEDLPETPWPVHQGADHRTRPALPDQLDGLVEAGSDLLAVPVADLEPTHP